MNYNNNNNWGGGPFVNNRNNNYTPQNSPQNAPKRNGAKESRQRAGKNEGGVVVTGWNKTRSKGFVTVKAFENSKSTKYKNKLGQQGITMMFEIFYHDSGNTILEVAPYNMVTGVARLEKTNMLISTKKNYFGKIPQK